MNMVEDFYNLDPVQNGEDQLPDYFGEATEHSLPEDYMAIQEKLLEGNTNIAARSVKCRSPDCDCDQSCRKDESITNRRIDFSSHDHISKKDTKSREATSPPENTSHLITDRHTQDGEDDTSPFSPGWQSVFDEWNPPATEESTIPGPTR